MNPSPGPARRRVLNRSQATLVRGLFSEILHRDLDAIVVHLLVFGLRLLTTLRAAMEKLDHIRNRGTRRPIERVDPRRRAHIDETVEIEVNHVVIQGADIYAPRRLVANAEHFHPVALWGNVFIAPPAILKPDAAGCGATAFEPDALRPRPVSRYRFWIRHFHRRHQIDYLSLVFALNGKDG